MCKITHDARNDCVAEKIIQHFLMLTAQTHLCARRWDARRRALSSIRSAGGQVLFGSTMSTALAQVRHLICFIGSALVIRELRSVSLFDVARGLSPWLENGACMTSTTHCSSLAMLASNV